MKSGVPWNVRGVRADARHTAREAARRTGMSVGDWLNSAILQSAADDGVHPDDIEDHAEHPAPRQAEHPAGQNQGDLTSITERLDHLTQQIERVVSLTSAPKPVAATPPHTPNDWGRRYPAQNYAESRPQHAYPETRTPPPRPDAGELPFFEPPAGFYQQAAYYPAYPARPPTPAPAPPPRRFEAPPAQMARPAFEPDAQFDNILAEIAARQHALETESGSSFGPASAPAFGRREAEASIPQAARPLPPTQGMPREPDAGGHARMPWQPAPPPPWPTQDFSGLEGLLHNITAQIEKLHRSGEIDAALASLRDDLSDIARTLLDAMPRHAVEALESEVRALAYKIEQTRQVGVDPDTIAGMERGLAEVRDALRALTPAENLAGFPEAVTALAYKIDQMAGTHDPTSLQQLDEAIAALRGIVAHVASNETLSQLAEEMHELSAKIDRIGMSGAGMSADAFSALEDRISLLTDQLKMRADGAAMPPQLDDVIRDLTERLDRVHLSAGDNVALGHLEDRIVTLVEKLDASDARLSRLGAVERGLADLLVHLEELRAGNGLAGLREPPPAPEVDNLQRQVERAQNSIEDVHGTLDHVVDRLAMIETDIRGEAPRPTVTAPTRPVVVNPIPMPEPAEPTAPSMQPPHAQRQPIDPNLPPDFPLEPGSGTPGMRAIPTAAERIAASEAALSTAKPSAPQNAGHSNFIAAARRAAQTANPGATVVLPDGTEEPDNKSDGGKTISKRVRSLLTGISVIVVIFGAAKVATNFVDRPEGPVIDMPVVKDATPSEPAQRPAELSRESSLPTPPDTVASSTPIPALKEMAASSMPAPRVVVPQPWHADVTGSIPQPAAPAPGRAAAVPPVSPGLPPAPVLDAEKLPAALRAAMAKGDAAAEYEAGTRYLEGRGIATNLEEAARWLERAAKAGLAPAQFRLGSLYEKGQGVKKDLGTARKYYVSAADKGNAKAMHNLAVLYAEGFEGKPDYKTAAIWFLKGAERGIADSQYNLAILYARGIGVEQNLMEAYKWFALAANQGDKESARKRDDVGERLDQQSLITARLAVQTWNAEPQPEEATTVKAPPGGWDRGEAGPPAKKQRASSLAKTASK